MVILIILGTIIYLAGVFITAGFFDESEASYVLAMLWVPSIIVYLIVFLIFMPFISDKPYIIKFRKGIKYSLSFIGNPIRFLFKLGKKLNKVIDSKL